MGRLIDRVGTRIGYAISIGIWSLAAMSHALVRSAFGFGAARFALGLGESGNFPAGVKTVAEWFPRKERALATGIFNCGTNVGATVAPFVVPWIAIKWGWQFGFLFTGFFSAIWVVAWLKIYRKPQDHPKVSLAELAYIQCDPAEPVAKVSWSALLPHKQTWAFIIGKFLTDPIWWFYLYWLPTYFTSKHGVSLTGLGLPLLVIYNAASVGSIVGGWLSARFLKAGWSTNRARKTAMLICAAAVSPIILAVRTHGLWETVALISVVVAAHQGWSANLIYVGLGYVSRSSRSDRGGNRWFWQRDWWHVDRDGHRFSAAAHGKLRADSCDLRFGVSVRASDHPGFGASIEACGDSGRCIGIKVFRVERVAGVCFL